MGVIIEYGGHLLILAGDYIVVKEGETKAATHWVGSKKGQLMVLAQVMSGEYRIRVLGVASSDLIFEG
jgi:hypothetical protein